MKVLASRDRCSGTRRVARELVAGRRRQRPRGVAIKLARVKLVPREDAGGDLLQGEVEDVGGRPLEPRGAPRLERPAPGCRDDRQREAIPQDLLAIEDDEWVHGRTSRDLSCRAGIVRSDATFERKQRLFDLIKSRRAIVLGHALVRRQIDQVLGVSPVH